MTKTLIILALLSLLNPNTAHAQNEISGDFRVCPEQPPTPEWITDMPFRQAHMQLLAQQMYRAQSMEAVVVSQECSCTTRFPPWDEVRTQFLELHANLDRWGATEKTEEYRNIANQYRPIAMPICEAQGNW
jgi:hypothetical protein